MSVKRPPTIGAVCVLLLLTFVAAPERAAAATVPSGFAHTTYASGLNRATSMAFAPDGRLFVAEQGGTLRVIKNGVVNATPFVMLNVDSSGERGLNGVAFDPNFATNRFVYLYYTTPSPSPHNRVSRFVAEGDVAQRINGVVTETVLLELDNLGSVIHNGGALHFGSDGKLYVAVGDNGDGAHAQSLTTLLGKMLRINSNGSIPPDNPFLAQTTGRNEAIWSLGLRNPFTFAVQPGTGRIFINDVGQNAWEEVNEGVSAANYGWPATEGPTTDPRFRSPFYAYHHTTGTVTGCAITGGAFYNPTTATFPSEYVGSYFFADYCGNWIKRLDPATGAVTNFLSASSAEPIDVKVGPDGSLYYLSRSGGTDGNVGRVVYTNTQAPMITQHPASRTVSVGQSTTFTAAASGSEPLSYQWRRNDVNIPGATSASYTLASASSADDGARFRCVVTNTAGTATTNEAVLTVTSNQPPTGSITAPSAGTTYAGGDVVTYAGTGSDPETGTLPASAFTWWVDFHHDAHTHPFLAPVSGSQSGQFSVPTSGHTESNVWYRIHLLVKDSAGFTHESIRNVMPRKSTITLQTEPDGLQVNLDDQPRIAPYAVQSVVGVARKVEAPSSQIVNGATYEFASWSNGGASAHYVTTSAVNSTYVATYRLVVSPPVAAPTPEPAPVPVPVPVAPTSASAPPASVSPTPIAPPLPALNRTIRITKVLYNPPGRDSRTNLNGEYIRLKNIGRTAVTLTGWTVRDAYGWTYTFPRTRLYAGASITVFTGKGKATSTRRYWGRTRYVWNNIGKENARVRDRHRRTVDGCAWTSRAAGYTFC